MNVTTLEVTFRKVRPFAAYLRLNGPRAKVKSTKDAAPSLLVDFYRAPTVKMCAFE